MNEDTVKMNIKQHLRQNKDIAVCISEKLNCIYMKIAKAGSTSVYRGVMLKEDPDAFTRKGNEARYDEWLDDLTDEKWQSYYRFTFTRNPWARMVSLYHYFRLERRYSFEDFIKIGVYKSTWHRGLMAHAIPQWKYINGSRGGLLNFVGKIESPEDFENVQGCLKIDTMLPHCNSTRPSAYTDYYDDNLRKILREDYKADIRFLNYEFGVDDAR